ncbi:cytochrome P460 family protein [Elongatibacter sediminis]|uniref:Cytochrome P460 family protein n=1 Tax=Elongatibacter sediminis TaxID=3119006 RepID=A0AAW9R5W9_9GAMM
MKRVLTAMVVAGTMAGTWMVALAEDAAVAYPDGYRDWHHVKSMVIEEGHALYGAFGGIHHLYANEAAVQGYRTGQFPDGAVIVFDLLAAEDAGNALTEGARKVVGVMERDAGRFGDTGGWGFEGFGGGDPENRVVGADAATACFGCHAPQESTQYVFSTMRDGE